MTALSVKPSEPIVITQYDVLLGDIEQAKKDDLAASFNYDTREGDKAARSHVNKLRLIKGNIERQRKAAKEYALDYGRQVDAKARELTEQVESLIRPHQAQLEAVAAREAQRVAAHEARLKKAEALGRLAFGTTAAEFRQLLEALDQESIEGLEEFTDRVAAAITKSRQALTTALAAAEKAEAQAAELQRLQAEAAERQREEAEAAAAAAAKWQRQEEAAPPPPRYLQEPLQVGDAAPAPQEWNPGEQPRPVGDTAPGPARYLRGPRPGSWQDDADRDIELPNTPLTPKGERVAAAHAQLSELHTEVRPLPQARLAQQIIQGLPYAQRTNYEYHKVVGVLSQRIVNGTLHPSVTFDPEKLT